jgi:hypothetical protein
MLCQTCLGTRLNFEVVLSYDLMDFSKCYKSYPNFDLALVYKIYHEILLATLLKNYFESLK